MPSKFLLFSKDSCGPCRLVDKYLNALGDERTNIIQKINLEDVSDVPIPQENLDLAKAYGVTATPVLIVTSECGLKEEEYIGGVPITKNIKKTLDKYYVQST
ncbi:MAG: thioredoxin family protein [Candidatus Thorarchaeota archaeon]|jgi:thiol-disulfide isomerase/thioredoxin